MTYCAIREMGPSGEVWLVAAISDDYRQIITERVPLTRYPTHDDALAYAVTLA